MLLDAFRLRIGLVDLVDRDNDRHSRGLGVIDSFEGLRHDAVIGSDDNDDDVGDLGAARTHTGKCFVARGIQEDDLAARGRRAFLA